MPKSSGQSVLQLRAQLREVEPIVWRRLLVPAGARLGKLHSVLQAAMGWSNCHLHCFKIGHLTYGTMSDGSPPDELDEDAVLVLTAIGHQRRFVYEYDFGDSWEHDIVVEDRLTTPLGLKFAVCLDGQNSCPPEDCGGPPGYEEILEALADPEHEAHDKFSSWLGGALDPARFDLATTNAALQRVR